ncbi:MAG: family 1 glycosylhydrolase [Clostridia bacterium]|nr:family 1 glycosylhydrolase [Clostridia bacterium]
MNDVFAIKGFKFPKDFLFGSATAGHQIEGDNIYSDYWFAEQKKLAQNPDCEVSGKACNSYNLYEKDSELLAELKHKVYRMSVEWARIEPQEGTFDSKAVEHYIKVFESLKVRGIKICVTLVHFSVPLWFGAKGGFSNSQNISYFERFVKYIVPKIAEYVDLWCVFNETNVTLTEDGLDYKINCLVAHARAYHIIKAYSNKPVSTAHALIYMHGKRQGDPFDMALQNFNDVLCNEYFFHAIRTGEIVVPHRDAVYDRSIKDTCDFWAINTYLRSIVDSRVASTHGKRYSFSKMPLLPTEFYLDEFDPECIIHNLSRLKDKPVIITENGISCHDDRFRIVWLVEYLAALNEVMNMGVDVKGYLYWSLLDNYEWGSFIPKFGLIEVDRENGFERKIKPSGYFYREIIENNGYDPKMLEKYLTELPKTVY